MSTQLSLGEWLHTLIPLVRQAGEAVMNLYDSDLKVREKADRSPVTAADMAAEAILVPALERIDQAIPVVSEEQAETGILPEVGECFWLVDPLDGTKEFISRNGEFTINVALIKAGEPILGVVYAPALDRLFAGAKGLGAFVEEQDTRRSLHTRQQPNEGLTVVSSRSHGDDDALSGFLRDLPVAQRVSAGSSLKLCLVAAGEADLYPRLGRTMEWDIAAGDAVLRAAGGATLTLDGARLLYGKTGFDNPHFAAWGQCN
ncbi:3'(2'),5'-bisphosphate nucleotidase CysQ [Halopseudomonas phragmitis]|uniref:3'(2'),5'-bisphosphate nucleotidase CysQ n=1 Tax=Halopseudomonas phragmitis TaxID=1931241 RepID=A0A1V0B9C3_9GAMM|nr:3'(2'),5'-bisphosphate nucleotidase CysQ [Halopseudomonas phragmitis]AQZ96490.1 3'(2'),5'-bisphosphate nucleotidase [Halopseudomonas phragmitis]